MDTISLHLSPEQRRALYRIACDEDVSIGEIVLQSIEKEIDRRTKALEDIDLNEHTIVTLRALLAADFTDASNWHDLKLRLNAKGYVVEECDRNFALFREDGTKLCRLCDLGTDFSSLVTRIGAPVPEQPHVSVAHQS